MSAIDTAIDYASRGFFVFPILPGQKIPYKNFPWRTQSTNDVELIRKAGASKKYKNCNWALDVGRSGLLVVDIDIKKGKNGLDSVKKLGVTLDSGFCVKTPTGGFHYYYDGPGSNSSDEIGRGIDTRGDGGYVLIPGSTNGNGDVYELISDGDIPPVPTWVPPLLQKQPAPRKKDHEIPLIELDKEHNIQNAGKYLQYEATPAIEGQGGNSTTYQTLCHVRDLGVAETTCLDLAAEHYNPRCQPPWALAELKKLTANVYNYAKDRPGNSSPDVLFKNVNVVSDDILFWCKDLDACQLKPRKWLLGYRYLPGYATVTVAPPGTGKSTLIISEAMSIASGKPLTHDTVHVSGRAWIYNTEDPLDELKNRVYAAAKYNGLTNEDISGLAITSGYENPIKLASLDDRGRPIANIELINKLISRIKQHGIKLFVIDPLIRCHALKENDNDQMDFLMQIFSRIAKETGCACSLVHHTPKNQRATGDMNAARGAGALIGAARIVHTVYNMSPKEASNYGISAARASWYMRIDNAKANLSPPGCGPEWYEKKSEHIFFDSDQTTGIVAPIQLEEVENRDIDELIIEKMSDVMSSGDKESVNTIAQKIYDDGLFSISLKTLGRKLETLLSRPITHLTVTFRLVDGIGKNGRKTKLIVAE